MVIDRYGAIARIEAGAILETEVWERLIERYISDDYTQTFTPGESTSDPIGSEISKPDITVAADHYEKMAEAVNDTANFPDGASVTYYGETENEYAWPFLFDAVDGVSENGEKVLYSSNAEKPNSLSVLYADVTVDAGMMLVFDYYCETEENLDVLSIVWDGKIIKEISGVSKGWQTCQLYSDITDGLHKVGFTYMKDKSINTGKDNVYIKNIRFAPLSTLKGPADMLRGAAYGRPEDNANEFPYYAKVELGADGYYYVDRDSLENSALAGNDSKPMLFANLLNVTNYAPKYSLSYLFSLAYQETGEYVLDFTEAERAEINKLFSVAQASDVDFCVPVDERTKEILEMFVEKFNKASNNQATHQNEWLELCYYYSHYGDGDPVGNPIMGLTEKTAIPVTAGTNTAELTRNMTPFPITIYSFEPETNGVYHIYSLIPENTVNPDLQSAAQLWLYDDSTASTDPLVYSGDNRITPDGTNEYNFSAYRYMRAGEKYYVALAFRYAESGTYKYVIENVGQSVTVLEPASESEYTFVLDEDGNYNSNDVILAGAIDYVLGDDGYYHYKYADGTIGGYIYLDVVHKTSLTTISLTELVDQYLSDTNTEELTPLDYKVFDFRYTLAYYIDSMSTDDVKYDKKFDLNSLEFEDESYKNKFKDYTDTVKDYIAQAPTSGDEAGLVKVDEPLMEILTTFIETRINSFNVYDGKYVYEAALENEWLRFCWFFRTYDATHP